MWRNNISRNGEVLNMEDSDFRYWFLDLRLWYPGHIQEEKLKATAISSRVD
jgi:hypothetical protein